ncbi:MAG: dimethylarginine dimethylaminohydrolase family protein [Candidatus Kariarchaeaceae archaeon]|jgi:dimethylargininase
MIPSHAIVRKPGSSFPKCISSHPLHETVSFDLARQQHKSYCALLEELGLDLIVLDQDNHLPDSCFVEDNAILHGSKAFISRMSPESRRAEVQAVAKVLQDYKSIKQAAEPATIEGGDVIHTPTHLISGITQRTNQLGVDQMSKWLKVKVDTCIDPSIIHLKSYVTYLGNNQVLTTQKYAKHPTFNEFEKVFVPLGEEYAANSLTIGNVVIIPDKHPKTTKNLEDHGYEVLSLNMSQFEMCEGALTCLTLLF